MHLIDSLKGRRLRHIGELTADEVNGLLDLAQWFRDHKRDRKYLQLCAGLTQGLLFVYESTRTRMGFETAMNELGGGSMYMPANLAMTNKGETWADTARAYNRMVHLATLRLWDQAHVDEMAAQLEIPLINACTPQDHTTQVLAQLLTMRQSHGHLKGLNVVYVGMTRGVVHSLMRVCPLMGMNLTTACPAAYTFDPIVLADARNRVEAAGTSLNLTHNLREAVKTADVIEGGVLLRSKLAGEKLPEEQRVIVQEFQVNRDLMQIAKRGCTFQHSGPIFRGYEMTDDILDDPKSLVWEEAENAKWVKKALIASMLQA
ncbi:MAG: hypothetical protein K8T26_17020 [Lentisphaerae bacterium]|nr:hypothetical protein [Lentisphaerota bacterium]